jgi:CheY-like chemotaxis protein
MSISVLIVDDDPVTIQLLKLMIERGGGYTVTAVRSGHAALETLNEMHPQIILVDDMMPKMTGGEFCRIVKDTPALSDIPVIIMSAGVRVESSSYIDQIGADLALSKPLVSREVVEAIESVLASKA